MNPFSLEISVIQLAPTSSSCSSHTTIGDRDIEDVSDVYSKPQLVDLLCQSMAGQMLSINVKNTSFQNGNVFCCTNYELCILPFMLLVRYVLIIVLIMYQ